MADDPITDTQARMPAIKKKDASPAEEASPYYQLPKHHESKFVPLPDGGLHQLAKHLYPEDADDPDAHRQHVRDLLELNRDILRDDTQHRVGQHVRIP